MEFFDKIIEHGNKIAILDESGVFTYARINEYALAMAWELLNGRSTLDGARIAFVAPSGLGYVAILLGTWKAGGVAVPLCIDHPDEEWKYVLEDCGASVVVTNPEYINRIEKIQEQLQSFRTLEVLNLETKSAKPEFPEIDADCDALILYTSGTTGKPKGVVTTHNIIKHQITSLIEAWEWTEKDHILHFLPLHHLHGILNKLLCALWAGAVVEMLPKFDAYLITKRICSEEITLFMAVPTIYNKLIDFLEVLPPDRKQEFKEKCGHIRLMVSGSAALPIQTFDKWTSLTGHVLLERYGMTETGMSISNPLNGERRPGFIGQPLPGVEIRLMDDSGNIVNKENKSGEIQVRGEGIFKEYWQKPAETRNAFVDGWFKTGDIALLENGYYKILGRRSVDIIKTGGYKVSALEIENILQQHIDIVDCAVVGIPDTEWGEIVCAAIKSANHPLNPEAVKSWAAKHLAKYKIPRLIIEVEDFPRNAMGKVTKSKVQQLFHKQGISK